MFSFIYFLIISALSPLLIVKFLFNKTFRSWIIKKSRSPVNKNFENSAHIWIHAASVGEVTLAISFIKKYFEKSISSKFILTTNTFSGLKSARKHKNISTCLAPFDFCLLIKKFLKNWNIHGLVLVETEIWPNTIQLASKIGPVFLLNGRLSDRNINKYRYISKLLDPIFNNITEIYSGDLISHNRFIELGFSPLKIKFKGNLKFSLANDMNCFSNIKIRKKYNLSENSKVFVAGSIQPEELDVLLPVWLKITKEFPNSKMVLVPRHLEKLHLFKDRFRNLPVSYQHSSINLGLDIRVFFLPKIGILRNLYCIADTVFVGGSFCNRGGQNMLEAIVFKKPVSVGPYATNFKQEIELIEKNNGIKVVKKAFELEKFIRNCFENPFFAKEMGMKGFDVIANNQDGMNYAVSGVYSYFLDKTQSSAQIKPVERNILTH